MTSYFGRERVCMRVCVSCHQHFYQWRIFIQANLYPLAKAPLEPPPYQRRGQHYRYHT